MALICHHCQHENSNTAERCEACGTVLNNTVEMQAIVMEEDSPMTENADYDEKLDQTRIIPQTDIEKLSENETSEEATKVSVPLESADDETHATKRMPHLNDDDGLLHIGTVRFRGNLILTDKDTGNIYRIENEELDEAIIGRLNAKTGFRPQVDFTDSDGKERGVSRRHATINQRGDLIFVTDHNSLNGTFLNGQRLVPEQARVMRDSDALRIGHITLIVTFERVTTDS